MMRNLQRICIHLIMSGCVLFLLFPCVNCFGSLPEKDTNSLEKENKAGVKTIDIESGQNEKMMLEAGLSQLSQEEKEWYLKFQNGIPFFDGWKQISHDIISRFPDGDRIKLKENLRILGKKIGIEWCKDNAVRRIDTDMLRKWGEILNNAVDHGINHVADTINRVEKEVDDILINKFSSTQ